VQSGTVHNRRSTSRSHDQRSLFACATVGSLLAPFRVSHTRLIECLDLPGVGRTGPGGSLSVKPGDPEVRMTDRSTNQSLRR
jgi:hypothetical protein